jgi:hypothetical protein
LTPLATWAERWGVTPTALAELQAIFTAPITDPGTSVEVPESEAAVQNRVRLEASRVGARLWRNNSGAVHTDDGRFLRYGICNDSAEINKTVKSSDLIGVKPMLIHAEHIGTTVGVFLAREVKPTVWKYRGTEREVAQLNFIKLVNGLGGDACFANSEGTI